MLGITSCILHILPVSSSFYTSIASSNLADHLSCSANIIHQGEPNLKAAGWAGEKDGVDLDPYSIYYDEL